MAAGVSGDGAGAGPEPGQSVRLQGIVNKWLVREHAAVEIARILARDLWNADRLAIQEPLTIHDLGQKWRVVGSSNLNSVEGTFAVVISKANGQIVDIGMFHGDGGLPG